MLTCITYKSISIRNQHVTSSIMVIRPREKLGITPEILRKSVTDFARIPNNKGTRDTKKCRALLDEIEVLKPSLVVLVSVETRNAFISVLERNPDKLYQYHFH